MASSSPRLWKWLCNLVLRLVQLSLTACVTTSYGLWKWLASSSPRLWKWLYNYVLQLVQPCLTVYGNGVQPSFTTVQLCLTDCTTASYSLCNHVLRFMEMVCNPVLQLCNYVLQIVQLRLTAYGNGWQAVLPIYGNGFRSGTSENQRLHKKLGNSENRVTYRLR